MKSGVDKKRIVRGIEESAEIISSLKSSQADIVRICRAVIKSLKAGGKILTAGNGGSAAEALHMAEELMGRFRSNRRALPAVALTADSTAITCISNDFGYDRVFQRQIEGLACRGDVVILFSTSGKGKNLTNALTAATRKGAVTVCMLGRDGGKLSGKAKYELIVKGRSTERIQEAHQVIIHLILDAIEREYS